LSVGPTGYGTIYSLSPDGTFTLLHAFTADEGGPDGGLTLASDGYLYGVTTGGGQADDGIAYRIALDGSGFGVVKNFGYGDALSANGAQGELTEFQGALWGVTNQPARGATYGVLYTLTPRAGEGRR
jgi:uncharacterized repeat protein (TIGR03803 family)